MRNKLSLLALTLTLALTGCAAQQNSNPATDVVTENTLAAAENTAKNITERSLAAGLYEMAVNPLDKNVLYVASADQFKIVQGGMIFKLNANTLDTIAITHTNMKNFGMTISADGKTLYVTNTTDGSISAIDTTEGKVKQVLAFSEKGKKGKPRQVVLHGNTLYVSAVANPGYILVVDANTLKEKARIRNGGKWTTSLYYSDQTHRLYSANNDGEVLVINPRTHRIEKRWKPLADQPAFYMNIAEDPQRGHLFITDNGKAKTTIVVDIHTGELIKDLHTGDGLGVLFNGKRDEVYVSQRDAGKVLALDAASYAVKQSWDLPPNPNSLALSADGDTLYVTVKQPFNKDSTTNKPDSVVRIDLTQ